eukprot:UN24293
MLTDLKRYYQTWIRHTPEVYFVGHSLGGAVATLAYVDFIHMYPGYLNKAHLATYGSPRVFMTTGANAINSLIDGKTNFEYYRYVNAGDPVPSLPGNTVGFKHLMPPYVIYYVDHMFQDESDIDDSKWFEMWFLQHTPDQDYSYGSPKTYYRHYLDDNNGYRGNAQKVLDQNTYGATGSIMAGPSFSPTRRPTRHVTRTDRNLKLARDSTTLVTSSVNR